MAKCNAADGLSTVPVRMINSVLKRLAGLYLNHPLQVGPEDPFRVLVATLLSSRTKDQVTNTVMARLWQQAASPQALLAIPEARLAEWLKPVGFYKTKARQLHGLSRRLLEAYQGQVPRSLEELLTLPGVGRKVANLVLNICFTIPAICVDTHVHRISNRLGWVATETPEQTEQALMTLLPKKHWATINRVLVNHGQQVCHPTSPRCSICPIVDDCQRRGVVKRR